MDFAAQQAAQAQYAQYGVPPDASMNWVPPPGWVAPPGWAEYQQFLASQKRASQHYAYSPVMMPPPAGATDGSMPPVGAGQHPMPQMYPGYPHYPPPYGYMMPAAQQPAGGAAQFVQPGAAQATPNQMHPGQPAPYGYPPYPYGYHPQYYAPVPHPTPAGAPGQVHAGQAQQPTPNYAAPPPSAPQPEMLPATVKPTSSARPAPPEPKTARQPRVRVEFEDADSDDEKLERHDTLGMFDLSDIHEISERDFAELDDGEEADVQDAGIIEGGIAVQPAIPLKDTTSRQSTSVPVQSVAVSDIEAAMKEESLSECDESGDDEKTSEKKTKSPAAHAGSFLQPPPLPPSRGNSLMTNVASASSSQIVSSPPLPPSRTNSAMPNTIDASGANTNAEAATTPQKRRSTFGALLGAAAAVMSGSSRKLSVKGSQMMKASESGASEGAAAAAAGAGAATLESHSRPAAVSTIEERDGESRASKTNDGEQTPKQTEPAKPNVPSETVVGAGMAAMNLDAAPTSASEQTDSSSVAASPASQVNIPPSPAPSESNIVQIKVRTLAGKAAIFEVDKQMTMFEFRELIMAHFTNIPFDEQRLLYKGKMIEILTPDTLLEDVGFGNGDLVHLVRTVGNKPKSEDSPDMNAQGAQQPPPLPLKPPQSAGTNSSVSLLSTADDATHQQQSQAGSSSQQALQMLTVLVPPGRGPGDRLRILPNGRGPMLVTVPQGVFAGDRFRVLLPPEDPVEMRRAQELLQAENQRQQDIFKQQELARQQQQASRPQIMAVVVPKGYKAGQVMDVNVPGKGRVRVTIPSGVKAGQQFKFRLPS